MQLPNEVFIFPWGNYETSKGTYLFDEKAAEDVLANFEKEGVDLHIDLEHLSLDDENPNYNSDAQGWAKRLELKPDGLYAVDVRWTQEGKERLLKKKQRYLSPVFEWEKKTKRISKLYNIAIVAMPATHKAPELVAAKKGTKMEELQKIASALGLAEDASLEDILEAIKQLQDTDETEESAEDDKEESAEDDKEESSDDKEESSATKLNKTLAKRLVALEKTIEADKKEAIIQANKQKFPKSLLTWASKQSVETLKEFVKVAPDTEQTAAKQKDKEQDELNEHEMAWCKRTGTDPKKYKEMKENAN